MKHDRTAKFSKEQTVMELSDDDLSQVTGGTDITLEKASVGLGEPEVCLCQTNTRNYVPTITPDDESAEAQVTPSIPSGTPSIPTSQSNRYFVYYEPDPIEKFSTNISKQ